MQVSFADVSYHFAKYLTLNCYSKNVRLQSWAEPPQAWSSWARWPTQRSSPAIWNGIALFRHRFKVVCQVSSVANRISGHFVTKLGKFNTNHRIPWNKPFKPQKCQSSCQKPHSATSKKRAVCMVSIPNEFLAWITNICIFIFSS